jgi:hypothetical protein
LILDVYLSAAAERNMFVVVIEKFLNPLIKDKIMENKHTLSTDMVVVVSGIYYRCIYVDYYYYFSK